MSDFGLFRNMSYLLYELTFLLFFWSNKLVKITFYLSRTNPDDVSLVNDHGLKIFAIDPIHTLLVIVSLSSHIHLFMNWFSNHLQFKFGNSELTVLWVKEDAIVFGLFMIIDDSHSFLTISWIYTCLPCLDKCFFFNFVKSYCFLIDQDHNYIIKDLENSLLMCASLEIDKIN
jgi:hypothetical protein